MPIPLSIDELDNADGLLLSAVSTGGVDYFEVIDNQLAVIGTLFGATNVYADGEELAASRSVAVRYGIVSGTPVYAVGTTLRLFGAWSPDVVYVRIEQTSIANGTVWYLDSNGVPYEDAELTTPVYDDYVGIVEEDISSTETLATDADTTQAIEEAVSFSEDEDLPHLIVEHYANISDSGEAISNVIHSDTIPLSEQAISENNNILANSISIQEFTDTDPALQVLEKLKLIDVTHGEHDISTIGDLPSSVTVGSSTSDTITISDTVEVGLGVDDVVAINDLTKAAIETSSGLGQISEGVGKTFLMTTEAFDMKLRARKFIESIEVGHADTGVTTVAVDFRYSRDAAWTRTSFIPVNQEGIVSIRVEAVEFRVVVRSTSITGNKPDYINVRWKLVDKRGIRGIYGQSN